MRGMGRAIMCNGCGVCLIDWRGRDAGNGPQCFSSLYGTDKSIRLCKHCSRNEEIDIEEKGTNDIPELVKHYNNPY